MLGGAGREEDEDEDEGWVVRAEVAKERMI